MLYRFINPLLVVSGVVFLGPIIASKTKIPYFAVIVAAGFLLCSDKLETLSLDELINWIATIKKAKHLNFYYLHL